MDSLPKEVAKLDKRFAYIREHPDEWFKSQTPARQASIRRKQTDRERVGTYLGVWKDGRWQV